MNSLVPDPWFISLPADAQELITELEAENTRLTRELFSTRARLAVASEERNNLAVRLAAAREDRDLFFAACFQTAVEPGHP
jgi:hypothetical protein